MRWTLADMIMVKIRQAAHLRYRLVVVVAPFGAGKTHALHAVAAQTGAPLLDLYSVLSDRMSDLTDKQRRRQLACLLGRTVGGVEGDLVLLDGAEALFDPSRLYKCPNSLWKVSRSKTIVVALRGAEGQSGVLFWRWLRTRKTGKES